MLWHSPPHIATDNWYADLDDDGSPDVALGRLTADSPEELRQIVAKTLAYERSTDLGPWRRQLNVVAGIGGFGALADAVLESATRYFITQNIPAAYRVSMTYGSWRSPYCPAPRSFQEATIERLNEGALFWVYIGHGHHLSVDRLRVPDGEHPIFSVDDVPKLDCRHGAPVAVFLACYTGAIDAAADCLAEQMLRRPGGPVAILAGSRVTMPYGMSVMSLGLLDEVFNKRCETVGEAVLHAKQRMLKEAASGEQQRTMLDTIAGAISPAPKMLAEERAEHVLMFNLIGDPLLRVRHPKPIKLDAPATAAAGKPLRLTGTCPLDGRGTVELAVERGRLTFRPPPRSEYPKAAAGFAEFQETYRKANDQRLVSVPVEVSGGRFEVQLDVPAEAAGACHLCVFVEGQRDFALGSASVKIEAAPATGARASRPQSVAEAAN